MAHEHALTNAQCAAIFSEEVTVAGGTVAESFDNGRVLIARSILPRVAEVQPNDRLHGGVAIRVQLPRISVHPYVLRQVCANGVIIPVSARSRQIEIVDEMVPVHVESALRQAVRTCCAEGTFEESMRHIRTSLDLRADLDLGLLRLLHRASAPDSEALREAILQQMSAEPDRSGFALMNAVTAVARETRDPELRWRLELLGGTVPALLEPSGLPPNDHAVGVEAPGTIAAWRMILQPAT